MKHTVLSIFLAASVLRGATLPQLPVSQFVDTEVSTNVPLHSLGGRFGEYTFSLAFHGTPSNCVEVALGADANTDGFLSAEESELSYGWRNGRWFLDMDSSASRVYEEAEAMEDDRTLALHVEFLSSGAVRLLSCETDGTPAFTNLTASAPVWSNVSTWTSVQLLARGAVSPDETFIVNQSHTGTIIQFR